MDFCRIPTFVLAVALAGMAPSIAIGQEANADSPRADGPHPRLFLNARRLKLLHRERERQSCAGTSFIC